MIKRKTFSDKKIIFILGPTASGKSHLAHTISQKYSLPIISMDSMQIYSDLNIGTAKPSSENIKKYNYFGINIVASNENFSVGAYRRYVEKTITDNDYPAFIICGGTGLYYYALTKGLSELPEKDPQFRRSMADAIKKTGLHLFYDELLHVDPDYALLISKNDRQRIIRALEVYHVSGIPMSKHFSLEEEHPIASHMLKIGISIPRLSLNDAIEKRVDEMLESGWEKEARHLYNFRPENSEVLIAYKAIGYSCFMKYFSGEIAWEDMVKRIKLETRHYAKRQITWFKRDKSILWIEKNNYNLVDKIVRNFILISE